MCVNDLVPGFVAYSLYSSLNLENVLQFGVKSFAYARTTGMLLCCGQLRNPVRWRHIASQGKLTNGGKMRLFTRMEKAGIIQYFCNHKHSQDITEHFCSCQTHGYVMLLVKTLLNFLVMYFINAFPE
jgi:hypothetical protein